MTYKCENVIITFQEIVLTAYLCWRTRVIYVLCVCLRIVVSNIYCVVFLFCLSSSCEPYVASFSGLSFLIAPSVFSNVYLNLYLMIKTTPYKKERRTIVKKKGIYFLNFELIELFIVNKKKEHILENNNKYFVRKL